MGICSERKERRKSKYTHSDGGKLRELRSEESIKPEQTEQTSQSGSNFDKNKSKMIIPK